MPNSDQRRNLLAVRVDVLTRGAHTEILIDSRTVMDVLSDAQRERLTRIVAELMELFDAK